MGDRPYSACFARITISLAGGTPGWLWNLRSRSLVSTYLNDPSRSSGHPHGVSRPSPLEGLIGPGPATARRDSDRPAVRPRDQGSSTRCHNHKVHLTKDSEGLRNPHSVTRLQPPIFQQCSLWSGSRATPEATKPLQTHGSRGRVPAQSAMINAGEARDWTPTHM